MDLQQQFHRQEKPLASASVLLEEILSATDKSLLLILTSRLLTEATSIPLHMKSAPPNKAWYGVRMLEVMTRPD